MDDIKGDDGGLRELALFSGAGGGILGEKLLGWRTVCAVEIEPYAAAVLIQRQNDSILPPFPVWDNVLTFDGKPWRGIIDVVSGGFPCVDISCAGKGAGITGEKSGLWKEMARIISEVRPRFAFMENSPVLTSRGLGTVLGDLAEMGYDASWCVLGAIDAGAPHKRDRIWILAYDPSQIDREYNAESMQRQIQQSGKCDGKADLADANSNGEKWIKPENREGGRFKQNGEDVSDADGRRRQKLNTTTKPDQSRQFTGPFVEGRRIDWWDVEPGLGRVANGVAHRVDRLKAIGNGQVSGVAALAWKTLTKMME